MTNPKPITYWMCRECKHIYRYKEVAEYCCSEEEKLKYQDK